MKPPTIEDYNAIREQRIRLVAERLERRFGELVEGPMPTFAKALCRAMAEEIHELKLEDERMFRRLR